MRVNYLGGSFWEEREKVTPTLRRENHTQSHGIQAPKY
jgi:hypothetical protein